MCSCGEGTGNQLPVTGIEVGWWPYSGLNEDKIAAIFRLFFDFVITSSSGFLKFFKNQRTPGFGFGKKKGSEWNNCQFLVSFAKFQRACKFPKEGKELAVQGMFLDWFFDFVRTVVSGWKWFFWFSENHWSGFHIPNHLYLLVVSLQKRELPNTGSYPIPIVSWKSIRQTTLLRMGFTSEGWNNSSREDDWMHWFCTQHKCAFLGLGTELAVWLWWFCTA
jgi:hypothetical protein